MNNRKYGEIPDAVKTAPVTLKNYDLKTEWFGVKVQGWGDGWPFLSRDPIIDSTADAGAWDLYFRDHLGGFPMSYRVYRNGGMQYYNLPATKPEEFDTSYRPYAARRA